MKRYFVEYGILLVISVMARLMAGAGHPPPRHVRFGGLRRRTDLAFSGASG